MLNEVMLMERKRMVESLVKNSIISKDNLQRENLIEKLSLTFAEVQKIIEANPNSLEKIHSTIINNFWNKIEVIVRNTPGLTIGIKDNNTNGELYLYNGTISDNNPTKVDENTMFDLASVTKLFTAASLLKEQENGKLDLTKNVSDYVPKYNGVNAPVIDVAKFYYQINTDGRLDTAQNSDELKQRLYNSKIVDENTFIYSDIPYIILGEVLQSIDSNFSDIFQKELDMINTSYDTRNRIITGGNIDSLDKIHDPKAQKMKEYGFNNLGHAGIYSTSKDLVKFGVNLLPNSNFLSKNSIVTLRTPSKGESQFVSRKTGELTNKNRGMGVYIQTDKGIKQSDIAINSSKEAFASSGTTGPYILVDPTNNFTFNYLCNPYSQNGGAPIVNINGVDKKWAGLTNIIKEELINLVYELRYATNVFETLSKVMNSENLANETEEVFKGNKSIRK